MDRLTFGRVIPSANMPSGSVARIVSTFSASFRVKMKVRRQTARNNRTADIYADLSFLICGLVVGKSPSRVQGFILKKKLCGSVVSAHATALDYFGGRLGRAASPATPSHPF